MRGIYLIFIMFLTGCSIDNLADKILPDEVKQDSQLAVNAVMEGNAAYFAHLKTDDFTPDEFDATLKNMMDHMPDGEELSRHIIGANSKFGTHTKTGSYKQYDVSYEIKTTEGYGTVALVYVANPDTQTCCIIQSIYVNQFETSPYHETSLKIAQYARIGGVVILLLGTALIVFFVRRRRNKKRHSPQDTSET